MAPSNEIPAHAPEGSLCTIGEAADLLGVSVPTIRMYEREGLVIPLRKKSRHRRYSNADIERIRSLRHLINRDKISIAGIRRLLSLIPCWKIKHCPEETRQKCRAIQEDSAPCWMASGKTWDCRSSQCRQCEVYANFANCYSLKQLISRLVSEPTPLYEG